MPGLVILFALALLTACGSIQQFAARKPAPALGFRFVDLLVEDGFASAVHWRQYEKGDELFIGARDGKFRMDFSGRQFVWAGRAGDYANVAIAAEAAQVSAYDHNAYGLACRLDPGNRGRGYFFLISGDGYASIRWSDGRSLSPIVRAAPTAAIRRGRAANRLRAICVGDYLALWVNGEFVADARDSRASHGEVGLAGVMNYAGRRLTIDFDDLQIWRAALDDGE